MTSREEILLRLKRSQPSATSAPVYPTATLTSGDLKVKFSQVLTAIGGEVMAIESTSEIDRYLLSLYPRDVLSVNCLQGNPDLSTFGSGPQALERVTVAIIRGEFGVAENGAIWITDQCLPDRALPFICEHLIIVIKATSIVPTMMEAYSRISQSDRYNFGTFIAGPSKTADIEQSLVLGAHGPKTLRVFLVP